MEELIVKSLTDILTPDEELKFRALMDSDTDFRREYEKSLIALALADYALGDTTEEEASDVRKRLARLTDI